MSKLIELLKSHPEINLSAIARAADIKGTKLQQAVKEVAYYKGVVRKLTSEEEVRVWKVLKNLMIDLHSNF